MENQKYLDEIAAAIMGCGLFTAEDLKTGISDKDLRTLSEKKFLLLIYELFNFYFYLVLAIAKDHTQAQQIIFDNVFAELYVKLAAEEYHLSGNALNIIAKKLEASHKSYNKAKRVVSEPNGDLGYHIGDAASFMLAERIAGIYPNVLYSVLHLPIIELSIIERMKQSKLIQKTEQIIHH